jgi:peptidoglycan DL-endopeptidase CwlO
LKKNGIAILLVLSLGYGFIIKPVNAETFQDLQQQQTIIQKQREQAQLHIQQADMEINRLRSEQKKIIEQINLLDFAVQKNDAKLKEIQAQIDVKSKEVELLESDVAVLQRQYDKQFEVLGERARAFQASVNNMNYLSVLLESSSFAEFVGRAIAVAKITEADQLILEQTKEAREVLTNKQTEAEEKLLDLKRMKTELDGMTEQLAEQKQHKDLLVIQLKSEEQENSNHKDQLLEHERVLSLQEAAIQKDLEIEQGQDVVESYSFKTESGETPDVVSVGNRWIGNSAYVFGGGRNQRDISRGLFDCSSFVHWAFSQVGIKLGPLTSVTTDTLKHLGKKVSPNEMQPGDIVFFDTYKKDGHVGIVRPQGL